MDILPAGPEVALPQDSRASKQQILIDPSLCSVDAGLAREHAAAEHFADQISPPTLVLWRSKPALLVSRSEARLGRFGEAATELHQLGWQVQVRGSGGAACPVAPGTVQLSMIEPAGPVVEINVKYAMLAELIGAALRHFRVVMRVGLVVGAYCPGKFDLAVEGKKIAGMSQHWFRNRQGVHCTAISASINIEEAPEQFEQVVNRFYRSAGSPLRCSATALTNLRSCKGMVAAHERDLTAAVMDQIALVADRSRPLRYADNNDEVCLAEPD